MSRDNFKSAPRQPLLWAACAFACGIVIARYCWRPAAWWVIAAVALAVAAGVFVWRSRTMRRRERVAIAVALILVSAGGGFAGHARWEEHLDALSLAPYTTGHELMVTGHLMRDGVLHGARQTVDIETEQIEGDDDPAAFAAGVRVNIYTRERYREDDDDADPVLAERYTVGQRVRFPVKLREPRAFRNPGAWDYPAYLQTQGIIALGSVRSDRIELLPGNRAGRWELWRSRARRSIVAKIHSLWPREQAGLMDAMLIGERSALGHETQVEWQRTGVYHILVVSGMNVGILAYVVFGLLRRFRSGDWLATILTILLACAYAYLADLGAPVVRSVVTLTIYLIARLVYREHAALNAIGAAALLLLAIDPKALFDPSFQLTFLCVLAIAGIAAPLLERTSDAYKRALGQLPMLAWDITLPAKMAQFRVELRMIIARVARIMVVGRKPGKYAYRVATAVVTGIPRFAFAAWELIVVSVVMQFALALPMVAYFHRATVLGLAANMAAVPLTGVLMAASALGLAVSYIWLPLALLPAKLAGWSLTIMMWSVRVLGGLRLANLRVPRATAALTMLCAAAFVLAIATARRRRVFAMAGLATLALSAVTLVLSPRHVDMQPRKLEVTAIDVGQAESTLLVTPEGRTVLVDAGGSLGPFQSEFDFGEEVISPYLWSRGFSRIDALVLTHAHSDHLGGMRSVISNFRPRQFWLGPNADVRELRDLLAFAKEHGVAVLERRGGDQWDFGGVHVHAVSPPADWQPGPKVKNNDSLVLKLTYGRQSVLLTADAEKQMEARMAEQDIHADLMKAAHNGSKTSTTPEFLSAVQPSFAFISVGARNSFGHPRREVLERLAAAHVKTYRTDTMGALSFYLDGKQVSVRPWSVAP
jgi:competence protein ComEC